MPPRNPEAWSADIDPTYRKGQCELLYLPDPHGNLVLASQVRVQDSSRKQHLFREILPAQESRKSIGETILQRLKELDPSIAAQFQLKPDLIDGMTLRLFNANTEAPNPCYTALSYCWPKDPNDPLYKLQEMKFDEDVLIVPIGAPLFTYLQVQRIVGGNDEGICMC